jgi:hypothetical protein
LLYFADEHEKAKTSAKLMFLKGFEYDQCEEDATKGSNPLSQKSILLNVVLLN